MPASYPAMVCLLLLLTQPLRVVTTGDSLTVGYGGGRMQTTVDEAPFVADVVRVAQGGCTTDRYLALEPEPVTQAPVDFVELVQDEDPDVILLMLGTNDAIQSVGQPERLTRFDANLRTIVERFANWQNSRGETPSILLATVIPILAENRTEAAALVEDEINPTIRQVAAEYGLRCIDLNEQIQQQPAWTTWYNDGIHLWSQGALGYWWLAERFASAVPQLGRLEGCPCLGDLDCSGRVDLADLGQLLANFGQLDGDLNFDDNTDLIDLQLLLSRFGSRCD